MSSQTETGHAKNVANFEKLITNISGFGRAYNPSRESIKTTALTAQLTTAKGAISAVNVADAAYKNATNAREVAFAPLSQLVTRANNALKSSASSTQVDESAMSLVRKLHGRRATPKKTDEEKEAAKAEGKEVNEISSSQMSFDSQLDNFDKFIKILASEPAYSPNETELTVATLTTFYNELIIKNTAVINAFVPLNSARIMRDEVLYAPLTGLVDISVDVKTYVKSVFGATSPQYKSISSLLFTKR